MKFEKLKKYARRLNLNPLILSIPEEIRLMNRTKLERKVRPTKVDYLLRFAYWNEVRLAHHESRKIQVANILPGVCSYQHWNQRIVPNKHKLAWILDPVFNRNEHELSSEIVLKGVNRWLKLGNLFTSTASGAKNLNRLLEIVSVLLFFPKK